MQQQAQRLWSVATGTSVFSGAVFSGALLGCAAAVVMHVGSGNGVESSWNVRRSHTSAHTEPELIFAVLPLVNQQLSTSGGHTSVVSGPVLCIARAALVRRLFDT